MNLPIENISSRREFLINTSKLAAVSALAGVAIPHVHAAENNTIQIALIGCGGRGTGAASNALSVKGGPMKLVAMADVFNSRLKTSHDSLTKNHAERMDVPEERRFIGFDGYKHAMDCLKPGDVQFHVLRVRHELRFLRNQGRVDIDNGSLVKTNLARGFFEKNFTGSAAPTRISVWKKLANIAFSNCTQNRVANGMHQHIRIGMSVQTFAVRNFHAAQNKASSFDERVNIITDSNVSHCAKIYSRSA